MYTTYNEVSYNKIADYQEQMKKQIERIMRKKSLGENIDMDVCSIVNHYVEAGIMNKDGSFAEPYNRVFREDMNAGI